MMVRQRERFPFPLGKRKRRIKSRKRNKKNKTITRQSLQLPMRCFPLRVPKGIRPVRSTDEENRLTCPKQNWHSIHISFEKLLSEEGISLLLNWKPFTICIRPNWPGVVSQISHYRSWHVHFITGDVLFYDQSPKRVPLNSEIKMLWIRRHHCRFDRRSESVDSPTQKFLSMHS